MTNNMAPPPATRVPRPRRGVEVAISIPVEHVFFVAALLFLMGLVGVLVRRNVMFLLMSLEVMMNAAGVAFVAAGAKWGQPDGQVMFLLILALAAAEVAVALGLVLQLSRRFHTLDVDAADDLSG